MITPIDVIYSISTDEERECLASLAREVKQRGLILEVGTLYGGVTAVLALAAPTSGVVTIDDFSWHPEGLPVNSAASVYSSLHDAGIKNVRIIEGDSRDIARAWNTNIDLLWIDGGHSYEYVYSDLFHFGQYAEVIALHDYKNPLWPTIEKAIDVFLNKFPEWYFEKNAGMVAVLRRKAK